MKEQPGADIHSAVIQNLFITNGSEGETIAFTIQLRDSDGIPAAFQMVCVRDENPTLEEDLARLTEYMARLEYIELISDSDKTEKAANGGLIIENQRRDRVLKFNGTRWNRIY